MPHELDSFMLWIHPPLAIMGYIMIVTTLFLTLKYIKDDDYKPMVEMISIIAWVLTLGGLITGMIWAQLAWGRYWGWDPKESSTLALFLSVTGYLILFYRKVDKRLLVAVAVLNVGLIILTISVPFVMRSLH